jgi:membrane protein
MNSLSNAWSMLREAAAKWSEDRAAQLGAALAFYSLLSLAPLLLIAIAVAAFFIGDAAAQDELTTKLEETIGSQGAGALEQLLENARQPRSGLIATGIGIITLLFSASALFGQLQDALNQIWGVPPPKQTGILGTIKNRLLAILMVLCTGLLLLASLALSTVVFTAAEYLNQFVNLGPFWNVLNELVSFLVLTLLFTLIFKFVPSAEVAWRDALVGALLTALLFAVGKIAIGLYLSRGSVSSTYGAAGSLVVLLLWIYYSAQILFFGAELTEVYARRRGAAIRTESGEPISAPRSARSSPASPTPRSRHYRPT